MATQPWTNGSTAVAARVLDASPHLVRTGQLDVRLATSPAEIAAAQALRYRIFYDEMGAQPTVAMLHAQRDFDMYDTVCDHLLVIDHGIAGSKSVPQVVGTYRLLRQSVAERHQGFYSAHEFDLSRLIAGSAATGQLLELGRSCVAPAHRTTATISLLWQGIASYLATHGIGHMFGCASLPGTDPAAHAAELSYLHHHHLAPPDLRVRALSQHHVSMDLLPADRFDARAASKALPPLVKGYLRVGAKIGDGAFVDHRFNTVDVFVVMPVAQITARYARKFGAEVRAN
jgi:L-ornithine Nalpha-acyltransferase